MSFGNLTFTNKGLNLLSKAQSGKLIQITKIKVGDGQLGSSSILDLNDLKHTVTELDIERRQQMTSNQYLIAAVLRNTNYSEGFYLRELGIMAIDPDVGEILYAYVNAGTLADYIPAPTTGQVVKELEAVLQFGNASNVSITVNPAGSIPTSNIGAPGGVAGLDAEGKVEADQIPALTSDMVGLGNVDNTSDMDKPLSTAQKIALDLKIDTTSIVNDLTTGGETNVLSAEQGKKISSAIGQLQTDMGNIDVSWNEITGKPTTFAPAAHGHDGFIARSGDGSAVYLNGVDLDNVVITGLYRGTGCSNQPSLTAGWFYMTVISHGSTWVYQELVDLHNSNRKFIRHRHEGVWSAWTDPFGIVVSGKQEVVNAINGSLGYSSGLTTSHTHADYAWWIQNKVNGVKDVGFERMMRMYAAGHFAVGTPPAIPYSKNRSVSSVFSHKNTAGDKSYYSYSLTLPSAGTYLLIDSVETVRADTSGYLTSVGSMTQIAAYSYYYMSGKNYYGSLFKVTNPGIFYNSAGYSGMSSYPRIDVVIELTPQSLQWLAGTIN